MTNAELAEALEDLANEPPTAHLIVEDVDRLREAARRLRAHDAADITTRHLLADAVTGRYSTVSKLVDEVERLRAVIAQTEALVSQMRRDEANRVEQIKQHWSGEVERLRAAVQRVANERDEAQVDCDRWRDAHKLAAMRADAMDWFARDSVWSANVAALAMECGLAECERLRTSRDAQADMVFDYKVECEQATDAAGLPMDAVLFRGMLTDGVRKLNARLARAEAVIEAARESLRQMPAEVPAWETIRAALAAWDGGSDG